MLCQIGQAMYRLFLAIEITPGFDTPPCFRSPLDPHFDNSLVPCAQFTHDPSFAIEFRCNQLAALEDCRQIWYVTKTTIDRVMEPSTGQLETYNRIVKAAVDRKSVV